MGPATPWDLANNLVANNTIFKGLRHSADPFFGLFGASLEGLLGRLGRGPWVVPGGARGGLEGLLEGFEDKPS